MQTKDKIAKATWNIFQGTKDLVNKNIFAAIREGKIKIDQAATQQLLHLLGITIEEGFQRGYHVFDKEITAALNERQNQAETSKKK